MVPPAQYGVLKAILQDKGGVTASEENTAKATIKIRYFDDEERRKNNR